MADEEVVRIDIVLSGTMQLPRRLEVKLRKDRDAQAKKRRKRKRLH